MPMFQITLIFLSIYNEPGTIIILYTEKKHHNINSQQAGLKVY